MKTTNGGWVLQCPKDKSVEMVNHTLVEGLTVPSCPSCQGSWLAAEPYQSWQQCQSSLESEPTPSAIDLEYKPAPLDTRAALCPDCGCYLSRAKVGLRTPFYVERCGNCGGIWCDRGEWEVLSALGLHTHIEKLFSSDWQLKAREVDYARRERQATIEKLGEALAQQVFELAERLEKHPNGDFGVAYLMRRFEK